MEGVFRSRRLAVNHKFAAVCVGLLLALAPALAAPTHRVTATAKSIDVRALSFEPGIGNTRYAATFTARGHGYELTLDRNEAVLNVSGHQVKMRLVGGRKIPAMMALEELPGKANYFLGDDPHRWRRNVPMYSRIRLRGVYPGIDVVYYGQGGNLEFDFLITPGVDPGSIELAFEGVRRIEVTVSGDLQLRTKTANLRLRKPVIYQHRGGKRTSVDGGFIVAHNSRVRFRVGRYDAALPLIIDPELDYSTYLGGRNGEKANSVAVDSSGNVYVAGSTFAAAPADFPILNAWQPDAAGTVGFVAKISSSGGLVYSTYFGGGDNRGSVINAVAADDAGNAYLTGVTYSTNLPTRGPAQRALAGNGDAFVAKLDPTGSSLIYSTYLGGSRNDTARAIAVDSAGRAYVTGDTRGGFPAVRAIQTVSGGGGDAGDPYGEAPDAFVARLNPQGSALDYSTHLGGNGAESGTGIGVDAEGSAYVTGWTQSLNFPMRNPIQDLLRGGPALRSLDGGETWAPIHSGLPAGFVGGLVVDPRNTAILYAAGWSGIYKSTNGGDTWTAVNRGIHYLRIGMLAIDPHTSTLYASTFLGGIAEPAPRFYRSIDGGANWREVIVSDEEFPTGAVYAMAFDSSNASVIYVGHTSKGVLKSIDGGVRWSATGLTEGTRRLLIAPSNPSVLYATTTAGLRKTVDGGDTWTPVNRVSYISAIDPGNHQTLYGGGAYESLLKSTDGGLNWFEIGDGPGGDVVINAVDSNILYGSGAEGLLKSTDAGLTWHPTGLRRVGLVLAINPEHTDTIYVGTSLDWDAFVTKLDPTGQRFVYSTYLGGTGWDGANSIAIDAGGRAYIAGRTSSGDFPVVNPIQQLRNPATPDGYVNSDAFIAKLNAGGSALEYSTYLGGGANDEALAIAVDREGNAYIAGSTDSVDFPIRNPIQKALAGGGRLFKSIDGGATWSGLNAGLNKEVDRLAVHPALPSTLFASSIDGWGVKSDDGGLSWKRLPLQRVWRPVFVFDPGNSKKIYVAGSRGVFRSTDGGDSWNALNNGMQGIGVRGLAIDPFDSSILYAAGDRGIFKTIDGGANWAVVLDRESPVYAVGVAAAAPSVLYAVAYGDTLDDAPPRSCLDLLTSADAGLTWNVAKKQVRCLYNFDRRYSTPFYSLVVDGESSSTVYILGEGNPWMWDATVLKSTDGGASFATIRLPDLYDGCYVTTVTIDAKTPSTLYGGGGGMTQGRSTGSGCVIKSTDAGQSWQSLRETLGIYEADEYGVLGMAIDPANPATVYASFGAGGDAWVAMLDTTASDLVYSTFLGGSQFDWATGIAVDASGNAVIAGATTSSDLPTSRAIQGQLGGGVDRFAGGDVFVTKIRR